MTREAIKRAALEISGVVFLCILCVVLPITILVLAGIGAWSLL